MAIGEAKLTPAAESYPMNGGDGTYSYAKNSTLQRTAASSVKTVVTEVIEEKLDLKQVLATSTNFRVADLGCSVGPNTFVAMNTVLEAVEHKYIAQGLDSGNLEFQAFFNDHTSNDFNTLFASLPAGRKYFAAGVPGSFHGRLVPDSSLHFVHSSYAVHWLSKVPEEVLDNTSPAWNKGKIYYTSAPSEVVDAYSAQYARDMGAFLEARAKELVPGGMVVLIGPGIEKGAPHSCLSIGFMFDLFGSSLMDMAKEGLVSEAEVDSFNLPMYAVCPEELTDLIEINGCFSIERMELTCLRPSFSLSVTWKDIAMNLRSTLTSIFSNHFGFHIVDQLFDRFLKKTREFDQQLDSCSLKTQLLVVLKRK